MSGRDFSHGRRGSSFDDDELTDHTREARRLLDKRLAGRRRLFGHGRVLLRGLVEFPDGRVHLF